MRSIALRLISRLRYGVRLRLLRAPAPVAGAFRALWRWAGAAPLVIAGGEAGGLALDARFDPGHVQAGELARGTLEPDVQRVLRRHLHPGGVLFDVGANLGFFSLLGARLVGPHGAVHAFEPVAENAQAIRRSAERNGFAQVRVHERGAAAASGPRTLVLLADASWARLDGGDALEGPTEERAVQAVALDDLVDEGTLPPPTVVKIDVEGGEEDVLAGLAATIEAHRPAIVLELHGDLADGVPALLEGHGYDLEPLAGASLQRTWPPIHVLALPRT